MLISESTCANAGAGQRPGRPLQVVVRAVQAQERDPGVPGDRRHCRPRQVRGSLLPGSNAISYFSTCGCGSSEATGQGSSSTLPAPSQARSHCVQETTASTSEVCAVHMSGARRRVRGWAMPSCRTSSPWTASFTCAEVSRWAWIDIHTWLTSNNTLPTQMRLPAEQDQRTAARALTACREP